MPPISTYSGHQTGYKQVPRPLTVYSVRRFFTFGTRSRGLSPRPSSDLAGDHMVGRDLFRNAASWQTSARCNQPGVGRVERWTAFLFRWLAQCLCLWPFVRRTFYSDCVVFSFLALDLFSYLWHRANHRFPLLWRFHAVHHSDSAMDVTTAGRFHVAELGVAGMVRLPLLYLLGVSTAALLIYETTLVMISMMHHSTITLGRFDRIARTVVVTPSVHSVHHSRDPDLYGCNYSSVLSVWDRLFRTLRLPCGPIQHGLDTHRRPPVSAHFACLTVPRRP